MTDFLDVPLKFGFDCHNPPRNTFDDSPTQRRQFYEKLWARGGLSFW